MTVLIREANLTSADDCAGIVDVLNSYASDPRGGGKPLSPEVCARLPAALRNHPTTLVLMALADTRAVGIAVCFVGFSTFEARPLLNIHDLAVLPDWRGQGIGRSLLDAVEDRAKRRDCCKLTLEVQDDNPARALYERCGFRDFVIGSSASTRFLSKSISTLLRESTKAPL